MDSLADAEPFNPSLLDEPSADATGMVNPPEHVCGTCEQEIVRGEDGVSLRGKMPRFHPDCKPKSAGRSSVTGTTRVVKVSKADEAIAVQVEIAIEQARRAIAKAVGLLSLVDPYDAFVLHINAPEILDNLRFVMMRFEWLRSAATGVQTGGSLFGLVLAVLTTALPIMAHHNLIPAKRVAQILINLPFLIQRLQKAVADGDDESVQHELLRRIQEEHKRQTERQMRQRTEAESANVGSTTSGEVS